MDYEQVNKKKSDTYSCWFRPQILLLVLLVFSEFVFIQINKINEVLNDFFSWV